MHAAGEDRRDQGTYGGRKDCVSTDLRSSSPVDSVGDVAEKVHTAVPQVQSKGRCNPLLNAVDIVCEQIAQPESKARADYAHKHAKTQKDAHHAPTRTTAALDHANVFAFQSDDHVEDTEDQKELAGVFGIQSIPSLLFIPKEGQPQMAMGALPKETFKQAISEVLSVSE